MDQYTVTVADRIRLIQPGKASLITGSTLSTVRSTCTRIKKAAKDGRTYVTRPEGEAIRIWRLS